MWPSSLYLNGISFLMVLVVFLKTMGGVDQHTLTAPEIRQAHSNCWYRR